MSQTPAIKDKIVLKKSFRLNTREVELVIKTGKVLHSPLFTLRFLEKQKHTKFAVITPQKVFKTAVLRNATRRKIYRTLAPLVAMVRVGTYIIVFAKNNKPVTPKGPPDAAADETEKLKDLFKKAHILI